MLKAFQATFFLFISLVTLTISGCSSNSEYLFDQDYDFSQFTKVMDIGCGRGSFMMSILDHITDQQLIQKKKIFKNIY